MGPAGSDSGAAAPAHSYRGAYGFEAQATGLDFGRLMQAVPLGFALFLLELAVGGILVTAVLDWDGEVSGGFLFLNTVFLAVFGGGGPLAAEHPRRVERLVRYPVRRRAGCSGAVPGGARSSSWPPPTPSSCASTARPAARAAGHPRRAGRRGRPWPCSAAVYLPPGGSYALLLASLLAGALALGTVWSGMMLGHWYLVTPRLAPRPLLRLTAALAAVLVVQALLLAGQALAGLAASVARRPARRSSSGCASASGSSFPWRSASWSGAPRGCAR